MVDPDPADRAGPPGAGVLTLVLMLLLGLVVMSLWLPTSWLDQVARIERGWYRQTLGEPTARAVLVLAAQWREAALPEPPPEPSGSLAAWEAGRLEVVWHLVELACLRAALVTAWGPALLLLLVAGVLDGHWRWRIRQLGFDYPSPVARQASQTALMLVVGLLLLSLLAPLPLHPLVIGGLSLVAVRLIGTGITHLPKQL